ncbi:MAG: non-canonical purine NTP pyrophosphatase [Anaerolineales bacterium]|nr:non-canonical purine NTP pyrophosphatase [Anaerolineales bacterium]
MVALLARLPGLEVLAPADLGLGELQVAEDGADYAANAALMAVAFASAARLPALADDSGLEVHALGGAPGVHSARLEAGPGAGDAERRAALLALLHGHPRPWAARFVATVCLAVPGDPGPQLHFASGECRGEIIPAERGAGGFGYDPIFLVEGAGRTMAELDSAEKNQISHRARAVQALAPTLIRVLALPQLPL